MKTLILAGGKGTRIGKTTRKIPKPMIKIGGLSVLEHQINLLKRYGIKEIIILTGHLAEVIEKYFKNGKDFGVNITYFKEKKPLGTTGGLKEIENKLMEDFIVVYGDIMLDMDIARLLVFHKSKNSVCTTVLHPNDHPHDSDLVEIDNNQKIIAFHPKPHDENKYFRNLVNAGLYVMSPKILKYIKKGVKADFGKDIFPKIIKKEALYGYNTAEYLKDIGTPDRLAKVRKDYRSGKIRQFNRENKRRAIFLDRDGAINYDPGDLSDVNDFKLLPNVAKAIKLINSSEYLTIVITNQPMIAKGFMSFKDLDQIHKKMETLLGLKGAKLDGVYFCPHHPEKGFDGEMPELKIECRCRKPKTGMIFEAVKEYNIDLANSWIIGNSERDVETGINAKIKTILIKKNQQRFEKCLFNTKKADDLYSAVKSIIKNS